MDKDVTRDLRRVAGYAIAVLLSAVVISPVLYQGGKAFAEVAMHRDAGMLAEWADAARFEDFFVLTVLGFFLSSFPWVVMRMNCELLFKREWFAGGESGFAAAGAGAVLMVGFGCGIALGHPVDLSIRSVGLALLVALIFEWAIRGVLLGMLMRRFSMLSSIALSALVFAIVRVLLDPPRFSYANDESWTLGWEMIGELIAGGGFADGAVFFALGALLGLVRIMYRSLWPPVMIHAAWAMVVLGPDASISGLMAWCAVSAGFGWWILVRKWKNHGGEI